MRFLILASLVLRSRELIDLHSSEEAGAESIPRLEKEVMPSVLSCAAEWCLVPPSPRPPARWTHLRDAEVWFSE